MIAVEADRDMASILSKELKDSENITLINEPFEHWNHDGLDTTNLLVIGNLPYNLTTKLLELTTQIGAKTLGFMLQKKWLINSNTFLIIQKTVHYLLI